MLNTKSAVILAGGSGSRLQPLTQTVPKVMVPIAGQPFLYWQLLRLRNQGIQRALILVSYLGDQIQNYFSLHPIPNLEIDFMHEATQMGTGGALINALSALPNKFWLLNGDTLVDTKLTEIESILAPNFLACMTIKSTTHGNVAAHGGRIVHCTPGSAFVDAGLYWINREALLSIEAGTFNLMEVWRRLVQRELLQAFELQGTFIDIGTKERLQQFTESFEGHIWVEL